MKSTPPTFCILINISFTNFKKLLQKLQNLILIYVNQISKTIKT